MALEAIDDSTRRAVRSELARESARARWRKVRGKRARSRIMSEVRRKGLESSRKPKGVNGLQ
jgi:hypothetical protein